MTINGDKPKSFAEELGAGLTVMESGEHWFHTDEQMKFPDDWIRGCEGDASKNPAAEKANLLSLFHGAAQNRFAAEGRKLLRIRKSLLQILSETTDRNTGGFCL